MGAIITCFGNRPSPLTASNMLANSSQIMGGANATGLMGKREVELLKQDKKLQKLISGADPEEISGIGAYLLQHLNRDLDRNNYNRVEIAVNIIDLLLENCRKVASWPLLVQNYFEMVKRLLQTDEPRLETMGIQLFQRHSKLHKDIGEGLYKEYNWIGQKLMTFMGKTNCEAKRMNGFLGIKVICANLLLIHVGKKSEKWARELFSKNIDFLLIELLYSEEAANRIEAELEFVDSEVDFNTLFIAFLRELILRCTASNLRFLIEPIFKHLIVTDSWNLPNNFLTNFFIAIMAESGDEKLDLFLQCLIHQIINVHKCASTYELLGMANLLANFVPLVARPFDSDTKSVKSMKTETRIQCIKVQKQNFMGILELLQMSMDMSKTRKDIKLIAEYQDKLIEAMNKLSSAIPDSMKLQAVIQTGSSLPVMIADKPFFQPPVQKE